MFQFSLFLTLDQSYFEHHMMMKNGSEDTQLSKEMASIKFEGVLEVAHIRDMDL